MSDPHAGAVVDEIIFNGVPNRPSVRHPSIRPSICPSIHPPSIPPSLHPSVRPSIRPSVRPCIRPTQSSADKGGHGRRELKSSSKTSG